MLDVIKNSVQQYRTTLSVLDDRYKVSDMTNKMIRKRLCTAMLMLLMISLAGCGKGHIATPTGEITPSPVTAGGSQPATTSDVSGQVVLRVPLGDQFPAGATVDTESITQMFRTDFLSRFPGVELISVFSDAGYLVFVFSGSVTLELCEQVFVSFSAVPECPESLFASGGTGEPATPAPTSAAGAIPTPDILLASNSVERILPSVVLIQGKEGTGQGTGFFISTDGYILTNAHVVRGGTQFDVILNDGRHFDGRLVGLIEDGPDVGVLKINASALPVVEFGDPSTLQYGDPIITIGNPGGYGYWLATGGKYLRLDEINIVTDVPGAQGNSGGPLFTQTGQVVGLLWLGGEPSDANDSEVPQPPAQVHVVWSFEEFQSLFQRQRGAWGIDINLARDLADKIIAAQGSLKYTDLLPLPEYTMDGNNVLLELSADVSISTSFTDYLNATVLNRYPGYQISGMAQSGDTLTLSFNQLPPQEAINAVLAEFARMNAIPQNVQPSPIPSVTPVPDSSQLYPSHSDDLAAVEAAKKVLPSVIVLRITGADGKTGGQATGFFITSDGYILTNAHNVDDLTQPASIQVMLYDGRVLPGALIGYDKDRVPDAAVIKVEGNNFLVVQIGDSSKLTIGETLMVAGHPGGYGYWVVTGGEYLGMQDANITASAMGDEGASGSPVFNLRGEVIGILWGGLSAQDLTIERSVTHIIWSWSDFWSLAPQHGSIGATISDALAAALQIIAQNGNVP